MLFAAGPLRPWTWSLLYCIALLGPRLCSAQNDAATPPSSGNKFEVVSVKLNNRGGGPYTQVLPGRLSMTYYSLQDLVAAAYDLRNEQILFPGERFSGRYDIEAKTDGGTSGKQMVGMLQAFLTDEFKLHFHRETRQLPVYNLIVAKGGLKMLPTEGGCVTSDGNSPIAAPAGRASAPIYYCDHLRSGAKGLRRTLEGKGIRVAELARFLSRTELSRSVLDKTALSGRYDINFVWATDPSVPGLYDNLGGRVADAGSEPDLPVIFTAIEQQLGLKLESARGPVEVLVIDSSVVPPLN